MRKISLAVISIFITLFLFSCGQDGGESKEAETGAIELSISEKGVFRTILPAIDMNIASYNIHGDGPGTRTFDVTSVPQSVQVPKLHFGPWTVTVNAKNANGDIIATGSGSATVHTAGSTPLAITVSPLVGTGALDLTVNWPAADTETPAIDSQLVSTDSSSQDLTFTINGDGNQAVYSGSQEAGYHTFILKLLDSGQLTFGHVEVVRIIKDQTTSGAFTFDKINGGSGSIDIEITPEMEEPIEVALSDIAENITQNSNVTVTATIPADTGSVIYTWYINGEVVDATNTNSYTYSASELGVYNLAVTVYTVDGKRGGSASDIFEVGEGQEPAVSAKRIVTATSHTCMVLSDETVKCWGNNTEGKLGDGTTTDSSTPLLVDQLENVVEISARRGHTCALINNGTLKCWGSDAYGSLGNGNSGSFAEVAGINNAVSVSAGCSYGCALLDDGAIKCWGGNQTTGKLGDGTMTNSSTPVNVVGINNATMIATGTWHTCALLSDGKIKCWGTNDAGQLGDGTTTTSTTPVEVFGIDNAVSVSNGVHHTCAVLSDGRVKCWGNNDYGRLGNGTGEASLTPVFVSDIDNAVTVSVASSHSCAALISGEIKCWGHNDSGQLGDGTTTSSSTPVTVSGINNALSVSSSGYISTHSCAILADETAKCWGNNGYGKLGDGTVNGSLVPVDVVNLY